MQDTHPVIVELLERCRRDHSAWINGDGAPYALPTDGTILGAVGGYSAGGSDTADRQAAVAAQWLSGNGSVELVNCGMSGVVAWLVMIERSRVQLATDPGVEHRWDLRVTEVFERRGDEWLRIHRHADPLVSRRGLADAFAIAAS